MNRKLKKGLIIVYIITIIINIFIFISLQISYPDWMIPKILTPILLASFTLSIPYLIVYFKSPRLVLDLEDSREELIQIFPTNSYGISPTSDKQTIRMNVITTTEENVIKEERSKFIRIKLKNEGNKTAKNCRIKMQIYNKLEKMIHEGAYLYPSGYHNLKIKGEIPGSIEIPPKDNQIFDICSTNNLWERDNLIRFEDYFTHSTIKGKEDLLSLNTYFIKLLVSSENHRTFIKKYRVFKNDAIASLTWEMIDIEEFDWEKDLKENRKLIEKEAKSLRKKLADLDVSEPKSLGPEEFPTLMKYAQDVVNDIFRTKKKGDKEYSYTTGDKIDN